MSKALRTLQSRVGVEADGAFGPMTARAIADYYKLSPFQAAHLLGQASHESAGFRHTRENLNYRVTSLMKTWPSRFPTIAKAEPYAHSPKKLAAKVYANRLGNRTPEEAMLYIGRGFLQLTGRDNYKAFAADMRLPEVLEDPALVETEYAFETAYWFFQKNGLLSAANKGISSNIIKRITKRVNGGYHGLTDRAEQTKKIYEWVS